MTSTELKKWNKAIKALRAASQAVTDLGIMDECAFQKAYIDMIAHTQHLSDAGFHPVAKIQRFLATTGEPFGEEVLLAFDPIGGYMGNYLEWMARAGEAFIGKKEA